MSVQPYVQGVEEARIIENAEMNLVIVMGAKLSVDGNQWCWLFGENIQDGLCGFGASPYEAALAFRKAVYAPLSASTPQVKPTEGD